ncbi:MAG TPA: hypothetical protein EYP85_01945, partial [Armatimonadetes bacterium]|nr:hypothetical protein [Armatimonadota bacterium]
MLYILLLLTFGGVTEVSAPAVESDYSAVWPSFVILVWQYRTPPPGTQAKAAYESVNLRGVHLDGMMSESKFIALRDFARANGYRYYLDHAAGKGDLHLRRGEWDKFQAAYKRQRQRPVRPHCLRDPVVRARMREYLQRWVPLAKTGPVVAYAFDDEISVSSFTNPADVCWSEACLRAFRKWLQQQYGTIAILNAEWDTQYSSFAEAEPLSVDDLRHFHGRPFNEWNLAPWADHRSFMDSTLAEVLAELVALTNELDPRAPAGFVGGQAPAAYGGYDYAKLCRVVQWTEAYDIGATNEILRSFWGQRKPHLQTFFSTFQPHLDRWFLWYYFVHGNRGVICWPERGGKPWFEGGQVRPEIRALADTFAELQGPLGSLLVGAEFDLDPIAVYYSQPSIQVSWFMDIAPHGSTWVNRSSSLNNSNATDILNRWAWLKLLEDCGFQYNFVSYLDLQEGGENLRRYRVLLLPRTLALSETEAATIRRFVEDGGTVIADYLTGVFDEHGRGRKQGVLDDLFGVAHNFAAGVLDGRNIAEVNGEFYQRPLRERLMYEGAFRHQGLVLYERGLRVTTGQARATVEEAAVGVTKRTGRGRTVYLNLTPVEYLLQRPAGGGQAWRDLLTGLLAEAGLQPRVKVWRNGQPDPLIERLFWRKEGRSILCLVQNPLRDARIDGAGPTKGVRPGGPETIRLRFREPVRSLRNLRTGRVLGEGQEFTDLWVPCETNVYEFLGV